MPHEFLVEGLQEARASRCPTPASTAAGIIFLPRNPTLRRKIEEKFRADRAGRRPDVARLAHRADQQLASLGDTAKSCEPFMRQVFIGRNPRRRPTSWRSSASSTSSASAPTPRSARRRIAGAEYWYVVQPVVQDARLQGHAARPSSSTSISPTCSNPLMEIGARAGALALLAPTRSRAGIARIRTATSRTTARSTRCAATSTGCTRARRCSQSRAVRRRHQEDPADHQSERLATRRCSTTRSSCWCSPAARCRTR